MPMVGSQGPAGVNAAKGPLDIPQLDRPDLASRDVGAGFSFAPIGVPSPYRYVQPAVQGGWGLVKVMVLRLQGAGVGRLFDELLYFPR